MVTGVASFPLWGEPVLWRCWVLDLTFASMLLSAGGAERGLVAAHPARCHRTAATYGSTAVIGLSYDRVLSSSEASWEVRTGAMPRVAFSRLASIAAYIFASMAVRERGPNGRARRAHQDDASLVVHTPALGVPGVRHVSAGKQFQKMKPDFTASPFPPPTKQSPPAPIEGHDYK